MTNRKKNGSRKRKRLVGLFIQISSEANATIDIHFYHDADGGGGGGGDALLLAGGGGGGGAAALAGGGGGAAVEAAATEALGSG